MLTTHSDLEARLRAGAKRHPRLAAVALMIAVTYGVIVVWRAGYGVGRLLAQGENPPSASTAG